MPRKRRAPKLAPMTPEQKTLADEIQKRWVDPSQYDDCPMAVHISQALAQVIDGISKNALPPVVLNTLEILKYGYLTLFGDQHMSILTQLLGDSDTVQKMMRHKNARSIVNRIFERVGRVSPGFVISSIDISDILQEEGFST